MYFNNSVEKILSERLTVMFISIKKPIIRSNNSGLHKPGTELYADIA